MPYTELSIEERVTVQVRRYHNLSQREIARVLGRSPSTISRELRRNQPRRKLWKKRSLRESMAMIASTLFLKYVLF